jgi:AraC family transcriptional regulator
MNTTSIHHEELRVRLLTDGPGLYETPGQPDARVSIHAGPPVYLVSLRAGRQYSGLSVRGDIYITPAATPTVWEIKGDDTYLSLNVSAALLRRVATEMNLDAGKLEIRSRFQARDVQLENLGWALKEEMDCGYPCGQLYFDSLAVAVAARLISYHSSLAVAPRHPQRRLSERRLRQVFDYIEAHLAEPIAMTQLAAVLDLSVSHFTALFREATGLSPHQYVIRRRVERARSLLGAGDLTINQIAAETGFAHQSHLARHFQRVLGVTPRALRDAMR